MCLYSVDRVALDDHSTLCSNDVNAILLDTDELGTELSNCTLIPSLFRQSSKRRSSHELNTTKTRNKPIFIDETCSAHKKIDVELSRTHAALSCP